jgi:hypothetical protein
MQPKQSREGEGPVDWTSLNKGEKHNPKWEAFYKAQNIVPESGYSNDFKTRVYNLSQDNRNGLL